MAAVTTDQIKEMKRKYGIPLGDSRLWLSLSTLEPRKNIPEVIRRFSEGEFLDSDYLIIAGKENSKIFKKLDLKDVGSKVIFTGFIDEQDKWVLYKMAFSFVCLSKYEGYGIPVKEALISGLPLILSDIPSFREIVKDYQDVTWIEV